MSGIIEIPICISFTTPPDRRAALVAEAKALFSEFLGAPGSEDLDRINRVEKNNKMMKKYRSDSCSSCESKSKCTRKKNGRVIFRWEHPFGTIKRGFNQGYLLLKGLRKVGGEMGFTMLAYNMRRVINILGMTKLMESLNTGKVLSQI